MQPFDYVAPTSLAAATELLKSASSVPTRILAGGTDLLVQMRAGARSTSRVPPRMENDGDRCVT